MTKLASRCLEPITLTDVEQQYLTELPDSANEVEAERGARWRPGTPTRTWQACRAPAHLPATAPTTTAEY